MLSRIAAEPDQESLEQLLNNTVEFAEERILSTFLFSSLGGNDCGLQTAACKDVAVSLANED